MYGATGVRVELYHSCPLQCVPLIWVGKKYCGSFSIFKGIRWKSSVWGLRLVIMLLLTM